MKLLNSAMLVRRLVRRPAVSLIAWVFILGACAAPEYSDEYQRGNLPSPTTDTELATDTNKEAIQTADATTAEVLDAVNAARNIQTLPAAAAAALAGQDEARASHGFDCHPLPTAVPSDRFGQCTYGDPTGAKLMVIYGDSHATMWGATLEGVAAKQGWKLRIFSLGGCPGPDLRFRRSDTGAPNIECDEFHEAAAKAIRELRPDLVIGTSTGGMLLDGTWPETEQWRDGWISTFHKLTQPGTRTAMLGDLPTWPNNDASCLAAHANDVQKCSAAVGDASSLREVEESITKSLQSLYVPTQPWICSDRCEPFIDDKIVFQSGDRLTQTYAVYLTGALDEALQPVLG